MRVLPRRSDTVTDRTGYTPVRVSGKRNGEQAQDTSRRSLVASVTAHVGEFPRPTSPVDSPRSLVMRSVQLAVAR
jgi:hypothetical protein